MPIVHASRWHGARVETFEVSYAHPTPNPNPNPDPKPNPNSNPYPNPDPYPNPNPNPNPSEVGYAHPPLMRREEEGRPAWSEKRLLQLNFLFDKVGGALKAAEPP